jgi:hypothetical protein
LIVRPIPTKEFAEFLNQMEEWQPRNWKQAPELYVQLVTSKDYEKISDLQTLPDTRLPLIVRQAFWGWKNYFKEGMQINNITPTFSQVQSFLEKHPTYQRSYWRNIQEVAGQEVAGPQYLAAFINGTFSSEEKMPADQLAPFLKVALFNAEQAQKESK